MADPQTAPLSDKVKAAVELAKTFTPEGSNTLRALDATLKGDLAGAKAIVDAEKRSNLAAPGGSSDPFGSSAPAPVSAPQAGDLGILDKNANDALEMARSAIASGDKNAAARAEVELFVQQAETTVIASKDPSAMANFKALLGDDAAAKVEAVKATNDKIVKDNEDFSSKNPFTVAKAKVDLGVQVLKIQKEGPAAETAVKDALRNIYTVTEPSAPAKTPAVPQAPGGAALPSH